MPKQMAVFAARAAGIMPMGFIGSIAEFHDLDAPALRVARLAEAADEFHHRLEVRMAARRRTLACSA